MEKLRNRLTAEKAIKWGGLALLAYEVVCPKEQTVSEGFDRIMAKSKIHDALFKTGSLMLFLHCTNLINEKYDPIHQLAKLIKG